MTDDFYALDDGDSIQAFDENARDRAISGYGVIQGCAVTLNTGTLGSGENALSLGSGSVLVASEEFTVSSQSVDLPGSDADPRWDVVAITETGSVSVMTGDPEPARIDGSQTTETHRAVHRPAPPSLSDAEVTPLALVWVGGDASSVDADDVFDVRPPANFALAAATLARALMMHGNDIVNPGEVDGVDVSAHAANTAAHHEQTTVEDVSEPVRSDADTRLRIETRTNDPADPKDGRIWIRTDLV